MFKIFIPPDICVLKVYEPLLMLTRGMVYNRGFRIEKFELFLLNGYIFEKSLFSV